MNPIAATCSLLSSIGIVVLTVSPESVRQQSVPPHPAAPSRAAYRQPPMLSDGWVTASLDASVDSAQIERMTASLRSDPTWNVHAVLIERDGRLVYEEYFAGEDQRWGMPLGRLAFNREMRHDLRSVTKSVVSALIGIAIGSGRRESLDRPIVDYFPEYPELKTTERRRITVAHALTMTAGFEWNEQVPYTDPRNDEIVMTRHAEPLRYVLGRPIVAAPGSQWRYSGGLTQVLAAILERVTGERLVDYANTHLFRPLGVADVEWVGSLAGMPAAASGLRLRPRDLAKFGSLYLHLGRWNSQQVIPANWVDESTRRRLTLPNQTERGYAYQWWHLCYPTGSGGSLEARAAVGLGEQRVFVLPDMNTVVTILAGRYNNPSPAVTERLMREFIIPALVPPSNASCSM
jgi:CubicO group peptidase (beta-lactamase class C family)